MLPDWFDQYPRTGAEVLDISTSDHALILVSTVQEIPTWGKPFRLEVMWLHEEACGLTVKKCFELLFFHSGLRAVTPKLLHLKYDFLL